jgi:hypothetical protein
MHMPIPSRIEKIRVADFGKQQNPERNRHAGKQCGAKKKWPEPLRKECRSPVTWTFARLFSHGFDPQYVKNLALPIDPA